MMDDSDIAVVVRVLDGEKDAFRVLLERHGRAVFSLAYRMTGSRQDAEDIVQETFLRAFKYLSRFDLEASFSVWLHRIAVNYSIGLLRKRMRQVESSDPRERMNDDALASVASENPGPDCAVLNAEISQRLYGALEVLSPRERVAFVLRHFENRSIAEISLAMDLRESAAKQCIFRAMQKLRRELASLLTPTT